MIARDSSGAFQFHMKRLALEYGLLPGRSNYLRFIILGRGRSGSNFLRGLLNSHSQVVAFGELFRFYDSIGWEIPEYDQFMHSSRLRSLMQNDPVAFLEKKVFRTFPRRIHAVGFKLFYYHAREGSTRDVWNYLTARKDMRIIHIKRKNVLKMILSEKKAFKTNEWTNTTGVDEPRFSVAIDYEECLRRFHHEQEVAAEHDRLFQGHPMVEVIYENLSGNYHNEMKSVQEFLGVDYESLTPVTYKQANQPLSEAISNYFELKERFTGTRWEEFFET